MRPLPPGARDPLQSACFPLLPYANRIALGRFPFHGETYQLPRNFGDHPHSLHGLGWQRAWSAAASGPSSAVLGHAHDGGPGWPWAYRAEQRLELTEGGLIAELALTNADTRAMPAGLGFHPYFPADGTTRLKASSTRLWLADAGMIPVRPVAPDHFADWATGAPVQRADLVDNCYEGWDGSARIDHAGRRLRIAAEVTPDFHLYIPPGAGFFCFEPVTHLPDALNRGGMVVLAPGETLRLAMRVSVGG